LFFFFFFLPAIIFAGGAVCVYLTWGIFGVASLPIYEKIFTSRERWLAGWLVVMAGGDGQIKMFM
jgi:hypothetical protein